jgi:hypothetical protein
MPAEGSGIASAPLPERGECDRTACSVVYIVCLSLVPVLRASLVVVDDRLLLAYSSGPYKYRWPYRRAVGADLRRCAALRFLGSSHDEVR